MKYLRTFTIICAIGLLYSSCVKKANYPNVPIISFNSFNSYYVGASDVIDSSILRLNFTDGNGDIGYPSQQQDVSPDLYVEPLVYFYATQTYGPIYINGDSTYSYNIPDITPSGSDKELSGIIQVNLEGSLQDINNFFITNAQFDSVADHHRLQLEIWIFDRAGNKSNVLLSPVVLTRPEGN